MTIREFSRRYIRRDDRRAWIELSVTVCLYLASLSLAIQTAQTWWLVVPFTVLMGLFGVRIYMLQHDCMHRSLFDSGKMNDLIGNVISPIALSPFKATQFNHNLHHAHVGNLDHREAFEIEIMTIDEYRKASLPRRMWYRFYRSPFTLLLVGPFVLYLILRRFPRNGLKTGIGNVILHDAAVIGYFVLLYALAGWAGVWILMGSIYVGATFGALIPYVVHNFEEVYWDRRPGYSFEDGALRGSSVLRFGWLFDVLTLNIAYHDLHHLNANVPCYNLKRCYFEAGDLLESREVGWREAFSCYGWKLYDEEARKMVGFRAAAPV